MGYTRKMSQPYLKRSKSLEARGFSFEAAEASVALLLSRQQKNYKPPFEMVDFFVNVEHQTRTHLC